VCVCVCVFTGGYYIDQISLSSVKPEISYIEEQPVDPHEGNGLINILNYIHIVLLNSVCVCVMGK